MAPFRLLCPLCSLWQISLSYQRATYHPHVRKVSKKPGGKAICQRLVASSDVIVANMRPQALVRLELDAASVHAKHPHKLYCLITGYGTDGLYASQPTYDSVVQGASGIAGLTLARDGTPSYIPMLICDHVVGEIAVGAIMAAVIQHGCAGARLSESNRSARVTR